MPLFVNGEWFNPTLVKSEQPSGHTYYKDEFDEFIKKIEHYKNPVVLKVRRVNKALTDSKGVPVPPPSDNFSYKQRILTAQGTETWVYQETFPDKKDGEYKFKNLGVWVRGRMSLQKSEKERLFYLMKKSGYLKDKLIHHDPAAIAKERAQKEEMKAKLYFHIYNQESGLAKSAPRLKELALSFGVRKVKDMGIDELRNALFEKVTAGDDLRTKGIKAFLEALTDKPQTSKEAQVQDAIEREIILYNSQNREWRFISKGEETAVICKVGEGEDSVPSLMKHLSRNPSIENRILYAIETGKLSELKPSEVEDLPWDVFKRECEIAGIKATGRKRDASNDDLREWLTLLENAK